MGRLSNEKAKEGARLPFCIYALAQGQLSEADDALKRDISTHAIPIKLLLEAVG